MAWSKKQLGARRGRRGAALVEALVVIPFFMIIFAGLVFMRHLYEEQLRVMRATKESAWSYAMANCGDPGDEHTTHLARADANAPPASRVAGETFDQAQQDHNLGPEGQENGAEADLSEARETAGTPAQTIADRDFGSSRASMQSSATAGALIGGYTKSVSSTTRVMCNEPPRNGDLMGFVQTVKTALTHW